MPSFFSTELDPEFFGGEVPQEFVDFKRRFKLPKIPLQGAPVIDRAARPVDTGFIASLSSYISSYAADEPPEPSKEEEDSALSTRDGVMTCNLGDVFSHIA